MLGRAGVCKYHPADSNTGYVGAFSSRPGDVQRCAGKASAGNALKFDIQKRTRIIRKVAGMIKCLKR